MYFIILWRFQTFLTSTTLRRNERVIATNTQKMMSITSKDSEVRDSDGRGTIKIIDRPTFILKTREGESRAVSPSQRNNHGGTK